MTDYDKHLDKNNANFVPLTPISFLERAKDIYPNYEALIYEDKKYTWSEIYKRCTKFASALEKIGIGKGDTVSFLAFNNSNCSNPFATNPTPVANSGDVTFMLVFALKCSLGYPILESIQERGRFTINEKLYVKFNTLLPIYSYLFLNFLFSFHY